MRSTARSRWITDVFVIGGGPAGLAAAIAAAQRGFHVTLADGSAPPIEKPCGEGLLPETLAALRKLGVALSPSDGRQLRGISFAQHGSKVSADFPEGSGLGLRRTLLHERMMLRAQDCGVNLLWNSPASPIDFHRVRTPDCVVHARWIIGADGHGSRVRRTFGLEKCRSSRLRFAKRRHYQVPPWSDHTEVYWGNHGQAYVTPVGADEVCVVLLADKSEQVSFDRTLMEFPQLYDKLAGAPLLSRERGAVTATRSLRLVRRENVALIGDASGGVDAITGDGLRLAFEQAVALADAMRGGDIARYDRAHRHLSRRPMLMGHLLLWLGRHPHVRARVFRALQDCPQLFARMLATHVGRGSSADLLSASATIGWRLLGFGSCEPL